MISQNEATRRGAEAALAAELSRNGAVGVPAYTVIPDDAVQDQNKAKPYIEKSGAKYAVVMRATGRDKEVSSTPTMGGYYGPGWGGYGGFYGGFYGYGWGGAYGGSTIRTDTIVYVETLVYDLTSDKMIWAGQSSTMNPSKADAWSRSWSTRPARRCASRASSRRSSSPSGSPVRAPGPGREATPHDRPGGTTPPRLARKNKEETPMSRLLIAALVVASVPAVPAWGSTKFTTAGRPPGHRDPRGG